MEYPINCHRCSGKLYGPVKYCPFCGAESTAVIAVGLTQEPPKPPPKIPTPPVDERAGEERAKLEKEQRAKGVRQISDTLESKVRGGIVDPEKLEIENPEGFSDRDTSKIILDWLTGRDYRPLEPLPFGWTLEQGIKSKWFHPGILAAAGEQQIRNALDVQVRGGIFNPDKVHIKNPEGFSDSETGKIILKWLAEKGYRSANRDLAPDERLKHKWFLPGNLAVTVVADHNIVKIGRSLALRAEASGFATDALEFQWKTDRGTIRGTGAEVWLDSAGIVAQLSQPCSVSVTVQDGFGQSVTGQTEIKIQKQAITARVVLIGFAVICAIILAIVFKPKEEVTPAVKLIASADSVNLGGSIKIGTETSGFDAGSKEFRWRAELGAIKGSGAQVWLDTSSIRFPQSSRVCLVTAEVLDKFGHSAENNTAIKIVNESSSMPLVKITAANESIRRSESVKIAAKTLGFDLSSQVLAWKSDIGNIIGNGSEVELSSTGVSPMVSSINVTLEVHDKLDHSGHDMITIKLLPGNSPPPQTRATQAVLDPSLHDWFDLTGKPLLWYFKDYDGNLHFFDGPGYAPATGDELKPVTSDIRHLWEKGDTNVSAKDPGRIQPKPPSVMQQLAITSFQAVASPMDPCKFVILRWTVSGATYVSITPGDVSVNQLSGYKIVPRPPRNTRFILEARASDGTSIRKEATLVISKGESGCSE